MPFQFNGTSITNLYFNGVQIDNVYFNGVLVYQRVVQTTPPTIVSSWLEWSDIADMWMRVVRVYNNDTSGTLYYNFGNGWSTTSISGNSSRDVARYSSSYPPNYFFQCYVSVPGKESSTIVSTTV